MLGNLSIGPPSCLCFVNGSPKLSKPVTWITDRLIMELPLV